MTLRDKIIDESMKLFSLKGFYSTSLHNILQAANSSKGGFYNHFKSKEDLFFHVLERARKIWQQKNLKGLEQIKSPIEKVEKLLENYKDRYLKDSESFPGGCIFITLSVELNDRDPNLFFEIDQGFAGLKKMIRSYLDQGKSEKGLKADVDVEMVTEVLFSGMLGASVCYGARKSAEGLDKTIAALVEYLQMLKQ